MIMVGPMPKNSRKLCHKAENLQQQFRDWASTGLVPNELCLCAKQISTEIVWCQTYVSSKVNFHQNHLMADLCVFIYKHGVFSFHHIFPSPSNGVRVQVNGKICNWLGIFPDISFHISCLPPYFSIFACISSYFSASKISLSVIAHQSSLSRGLGSDREESPIKSGLYNNARIYAKIGNRWYEIEKAGLYNNARIYAKVGMGWMKRDWNILWLMKYICFYWKEFRSYFFTGALSVMMPAPLVE